jgi:hypothetical protein
MTLLQEASQQASVCLDIVQFIAPWCLLCTNSGGRARYWVVRDDVDQLHVIKLNKKEIIELEERLNAN